MLSPYIITLQLQFLYIAYVRPRLNPIREMFLRVGLKVGLILGVLIILTYCVAKDNAGVVLRNFKSRRTMMEEIEAEEKAAKASSQENNSIIKREINAVSPEPDLKVNATSSSTNSSTIANTPQTKKRATSPKKAKKKVNPSKILKATGTKGGVPELREEKISIEDATKIPKETNISNFGKNKILNDSMYINSTANAKKIKGEVLKVESTVDHLEKTENKLLLSGGASDNVANESTLAQREQIGQLSEDDLKILENDPCFLAKKNNSLQAEVELVADKICPEVVFGVLDADDTAVEDFSSDTNLTLVNEFLYELETELNETAKEPHIASNKNISADSKKIVDKVVSNKNITHVAAKNKMNQSEGLNEVNSDETAGRNITEPIPEHEIIHLEPEPEINEGLVGLKNKEEDKSDAPKVDSIGRENLRRNLTEQVPKHQIMNLKLGTEKNEVTNPGKENKMKNSNKSTSLKGTNIIKNLTEDAPDVLEHEIIPLHPEPEINEGMVNLKSDASSHKEIGEKASQNSLNMSLENDTALGSIESVVSSGIDFIMNTEVAKNAAMAMEVLDLTDSSLTDHVIEDNDMHGLIDIIMPTISEELNTSSEMNKTGSLLIKNNTLPQSSPFEFNRTLNKSHVEKVSSFTSSNKTNTTQASSIQDKESSIVDIITDLSSVPKAKECPPSGICLFWFAASDLCSDSSECPGEQLCCTVRCSKACIDV